MGDCFKFVCPFQNVQTLWAASDTLQSFTIVSKIDFKKLDFWKLLILSLGRTVTKNQWLNTKRQPKFFIDVSFWKGNRPGRSLLFSKRINKKTFADIWCLVIGFYSLAYPNEKKIWPGCKVNLIKASNDAYALECQHVWWGQAYIEGISVLGPLIGIRLTNLPKHGDDQSWLISVLKHFGGSWGVRLIL